MADRLRLIVFVGENDGRQHGPLYTQIGHRAHHAGLAGATVPRGIGGFGAFPPVLQELGGTGPVTVEPVEVVR